MCLKFLFWFGEGLHTLRLSTPKNFSGVSPVQRPPTLMLHVRPFGGQNTTTNWLLMFWMKWASFLTTPSMWHRWAFLAIPLGRRERERGRERESKREKEFCLNSSKKLQTCRHCCTFYFTSTQIKHTGKSIHHKQMLQIWVAPIPSCPLCAFYTQQSFPIQQDHVEFWLVSATITYNIWVPLQTASHTY